MSGYYESILQGNFLKREVYQPNVYEEFKAAYEYYKADFESTNDPVFKTASTLGQEFEKIAENIEPGFIPIKGSLKKECEKAA
jgi:hypothetical protein